VQVNVEGGGNGRRPLGREPRAREQGRQRAEAVRKQLLGLLDQRNAEAAAGGGREVNLDRVVNPARTRGTLPSHSTVPHLTMTTPEDRRRVVIWWTIKEPPPQRRTPQNQAPAGEPAAAPQLPKDLVAWVNAELGEVPRGESEIAAAYARLLRRSQLSRTPLSKLAWLVANEVRQPGAPVGLPGGARPAQPDQTPGAGPSGTTHDGDPVVAQAEAGLDRPPGTRDNADVSASDPMGTGSGRDLGDQQAGAQSADARALIGQLWAERDRVAASSSVRREAPELRQRLGPDPFGLRDRPPALDFMRGLNINQLRTDQLVSLFDRLNLANLDPTKPDVRGLPSNPQSVWSKKIDEGQRVWAPNADESALGNRWRLPRVLEMPTVFHSIWLGSPLSSQRRATEEVRGVLGRPRRRSP